MPTQKNKFLIVLVALFLSLLLLTNTATNIVVTPAPHIDTFWFAQLGKPLSLNGFYCDINFRNDPTVSCRNKKVTIRIEQDTRRLQSVTIVDADLTPVLGDYISLWGAPHYRVYGSFIKQFIWLDDALGKKKIVWIFGKQAHLHSKVIMISYALDPSHRVWTSRLSSQ